MTGTGITEAERAEAKEFAQVYHKVGQLKRAAIDAYMVGPRSWSWTGMVETWRIDSEYSYQEDSPLGDVKLPVVGSAARCGRPGPDGNGGGVVKQDGRVLPARGEVETFDRIRTRIDDALEKWRYLPVCSRIAGVTREFSLVRNSLIVDQAYLSDQTLTEDGLDISGVGKLKGTFDLIGGIVNDMDFMSGETARTFKQDFLAEIGPAVTNLGTVARGLVLAMAVQHGLWKGVHEDVERLVDACIDQCSEIVRNHTPKWQEQLRVLQTLYNVASDFFPAGKITTAATAGFSLADKLVDTPGKGDTLRSYDEVLRHLESALEALNDKVDEVERSVRDNLAGVLLDAIKGGNKGMTYYFETEDVAWASDEIDPDKIGWPDGKVVSDLADYLRSVADDLDGDGGLGIAVWCRQQDSRITASVARSVSIGLGQCGPGEALQDLNGALYRALEDLAWTIRGGADNLQAAYEWHLSNNDAAKASVNAIAQQLEEGSGINVVQEDATDATRPSGWYGLASVSIAEAMCTGVVPPPPQTLGASTSASGADRWSLSPDGVATSSKAHDLADRLAGG